jgi:hypothetical protein
VKRCALIFLLLLGSVTAFAVPKHGKPAPTPETVQKPGPNGEVIQGTVVCLPKQKWLELVDWFNGIHGQNLQAQTDLAAAQKTNTDTITTLGMSVKDAKAVIDECAKATACYKAPFTCWIHSLMRHLLWIGGAIVGLLVILMVVNIATGGALKPFFSFVGWLLSWILPKRP